MHSHSHDEPYPVIGEDHPLTKAVDKVLLQETGMPDVLYHGNPPHSVYKQILPHGHPAELPLEPSLKVANHSPTGFSWGYGGSGPAQLSIALLLDATGSPDDAQLYAYDFKVEFVSSWKVGSRWSITRSQILDWLKRTEAEYAATRQGKN